MHSSGVLDEVVASWKGLIVDVYLRFSVNNGSWLRRKSRVVGWVHAPSRVRQVLGAGRIVLS